MNRILITGSGGLVGSEAVQHFAPLANEIIGIDNNSRGSWFGEQGSIAEILAKSSKIVNYKHYDLDIRNQNGINQLIEKYAPDAIIHCAGQPSHEKSAEIPYEDFQTNTVGTVNLLEAARQHCPETSFVFISTNKVYGEWPNLLGFKESDSRYELTGWAVQGIDEHVSLDRCIHSPFGANKASADLIVQEYGRYYSMNTVCFRCGCITGRNHQGVEQHGFLSYLCKTAKEKRPYTIYGHKGKQVRDNIHAADLVTAIDCYLQNPKSGAVYNMGGGKKNSCSVLEAIEMIEEITGNKLEISFGPERKGDHICYITNYSLFASHYPQWEIKHSLKNILEDLLLN